MSGDTMGGGVFLLVAAALWLLYFLPSWLRRREYLATERNAVRLQQTLRILAETSELPDAVRLEATAREVAVQQKILKRVEARRRAEAETAARVAAREAVEAARRAKLEAPGLERRVGQPSARSDAERLARGAAEAAVRATRRARAATTLVLVIGLAASGYGVLEQLLHGFSVALIAGGASSIAAIIVLARLAARPVPVVAAEAPPVVVTPAEPPVRTKETEVIEPVEPAGWTPQPLPRPLYLSPGSVAATAMASHDAAERLRRSEVLARAEARAAELAALAAADLRPPVPLPVPQSLPQPTVAAPVAAADSVPARAERSRAAGVEDRSEPVSRFARMGVIGDLGDTGLDIDEVLRRRRAAG